MVVFHAVSMSRNVYILVNLRSHIYVVDVVLSWVTSKNCVAITRLIVTLEDEAAAVHLRDIYVEICVLHLLKIILILHVELAIIVKAVINLGQKRFSPARVLVTPVSSEAFRAPGISYFD